MERAENFLPHAVGGIDTVIKPKVKKKLFVQQKI
jgi:hypothetical protein